MAKESGAQKQTVERVMHAFKQGELSSGPHTRKRRNAERSRTS